MRLWHSRCVVMQRAGTSGRKDAMSPTRIADFDVATTTFLATHRNCPVEITISDLDCHFAAESGTLRRMELVEEPNGSAQLNIVLRRSDRSSSVKMIRHIHSINVNGRRLSVDAGKGITRIWSAWPRTMRVA